MPAILYIFGILITTYVSTVVVNKFQGDDPDYPGKGTEWDAWPEEEESGEILDDIKNLLSGLMAPIQTENFLGYAKIKKVFKITKW